MNNYTEIHWNVLQLSICNQHPPVKRIDPEMRPCLF